MAIQFIVETGTAEADATAYLTIDELKQYWDNMGYSYSALPDTTIMQYINKSSKLLDSMFIQRYPGVRTSSDQGLEWPRLEAYYVDGWIIDYDVVPNEIKNATAEMVYAVSQDASVQPIISKDGKVIEERVKIDVIEEQKKYASATVTGISRDKVTAVYDALKRLISNVSSTGGLPVRI